jgi:hypothetical protein
MREAMRASLTSGSYSSFFNVGIEKALVVGARSLPLAGAKRTAC